MGVTVAFSSQFCMHAPLCIIFQSRPSACAELVGIARGHARAIDCLVHWSSPVRKLVFSQQDGPFRRSSPVRKLVATRV